MNSLHIREATERDTPVILEFILRLADYERLSHLVVATEQSLRAHLFGPRPVAEVMLAEWDGQPAGFMLFFHNFSTFLGQPGIYLEDLFVNPDMRGRGIGKALLARLASIAWARGCGRLEWAVLNWNESSIGFYKSLGAVPMDEWTVYRVTGDALRRLADGARA